MRTTDIGKLLHERLNCAHAKKGGGIERGTLTLLSKYSAQAVDSVIEKPHLLRGGALWGVPFPKHTMGHDVPPVQGAVHSKLEQYIGNQLKPFFFKSKTYGGIGSATCTVCSTHN